MSRSVIAPVLTKIFNACISTGYFPKVLKTAEVVPIFKKSERELCSNYQRWSRGHKARGQGQGHKKIRGQGQGLGQPFRGQTLSRPRTGMLEAKAKDQGHSGKCSPKEKKKKVFTKIF